MDANVSLIYLVTLECRYGLECHTNQVPHTIRVEGQSDFGLHVALSGYAIMVSDGVEAHLFEQGALLIVGLYSNVLARTCACPEGYRMHQASLRRY